MKKYIAYLLLLATSCLGVSAQNADTIINSQLVRNGDKWGVAIYQNLEPKFLLDCEYDSVEICDTYTTRVYICRQGGKYGLFDVRGKALTSLTYDDMEQSLRYILATDQDHQCGILNFKGETLVPFIYKNICPLDELNDVYKLFDFDDSCSFVDLQNNYWSRHKYDDLEHKPYLYSDFCAKINDKWGLISDRERVELEPIFDEIRERALYTGLIACKLNGKYGYWNQGFYDHIPKYYNIIKPQYDDVNDFSMNRVAVCIDGKWGFINAQGDMIAKPQYDTVEAFHNNEDSWDEYANVHSVVTLNNKDGAIDLTGKVIVKCKYDNIWFEDGWGFVVERSNHIGLLDSLGKPIVKCKYDCQWAGFGDRFFAVDKNDKVTLFDTLGNVVIRPKYRSIRLEYYAKISSESDNYVFIVKLCRGKCKTGVLNRNTKIIIPLIYDDITYVYRLNLLKTKRYTASPHYYMDNDETFSEYVARMEFGLFDCKGKDLTPVKYNWIDDKFEDDRVLVCRNDLWGYIDTKCNQVIPCRYDRAQPFKNGHARVAIQGELFLINTDGEVIQELGSTANIKQQKSDLINHEDQ